MLQTLMLLGLGFLAASLISFLLAPFLWRYAVHATKQHIRQTSPLTMGEIRSDRDQLRAEHALTQRKLELEREKTGDENKALKIEIAELKKKLREISSDISSHGEEIISKDKLLNDITEERDRLKAILNTKEQDLKNAQSNTRKEKNLSARSGAALKEVNAQLKTSDTELKSLKKTIEKNDKQRQTATNKLDKLEGHIARLSTCTDAVKNLSDELLSLVKDCEKFIRTNHATKKEFSTDQRKLSKRLSALTSLEKSVRKQWSIASKAESGGRVIFAPLKNQMDYVKSSSIVMKRLLEKTEFKASNDKKRQATPKKDTLKTEEDLSKRIRSLQDKLDA